VQPCFSAVDVVLFKLVACRCQNGMEEANSESPSLASPSSSVMRSFPSDLMPMGDRGIKVGPLGVSLRHDAVDDCGSVDSLRQLHCGLKARIHHSFPERTDGRLSY
jgi:hypothetical protein